MVLIMEDRTKLAKALSFVTKIIEAVDKGDFTAIEKYKKKRHRLETEEDATFD